MSRAMKLLNLYEEYREDPAFEHLRSWTSGIKLVQGEGTTAPKAMLLGEAPGATENTLGRPFVGPAGRVLRSLMAQVGLTTDNSYITNAVKYRPPGNRPPTPAEIEASRPYIRREWKIIGRPRIIITLGATALFAILGQSQAVSKVAGDPQALDEKTWLYPMFHPSYALRNPRFKPEIVRQWNDLLDWMERNNGISDSTAVERRKA